MDEKTEKGLDRVVEKILTIEEQDAKAAGALGYMARLMVLTTLPHRKQEGNEFTRKNGNLTMTILAPKEYGLPYGSIPRLLLAWVTTEAVRTHERVLNMGDTLSAFMEQIGLNVTGGKRGDITRLKNQTSRLFSSSISCIYTGEKGKGEVGFRIADKHFLWWDPQKPNQTTLFKSSVKLSEMFFEEIIQRPVPVDLRVLREIKKSPFALDLYDWLTHRMSYLKKKTLVPWSYLQLQFGANYADDKFGRYNFKQHLFKQLKRVSLYYDAAKNNIKDIEQGLILIPGHPHIPLKLKLKDGIYHV